MQLGRQSLTHPVRTLLAGPKHMLNLNISVGEKSPSPMTGSENSTLEIKKQSDSGSALSPFQQLMAELAAQMGGATGQAQAKTVQAQPEPDAPEPALRQDGAAQDPSIMALASLVTGSSPKVSGDESQSTAKPDVTGLRTPELTSAAIELKALSSSSELQSQAAGIGSAAATDIESKLALGANGLGSSAIEDKAGTLTSFAQTPLADYPSLLKSLPTPDPGLTWAPGLRGDWQETQVSQSLTVITRPLKGLNEGSLSDFALQQGLDATTVRWLLTHPPADPAKTGALNALGLARSLNEFKSGIETIATGDAQDLAASPKITQVWIDLTTGAQAQWGQWLKTSSSLSKVDLDLSNSSNRIEGNLAIDALATPGTDLMNPNHPGDSGQSGLQNPTQHPKTVSDASPVRTGLPMQTLMTGQDLAEKMSLAIGKRMLEAIEKGDWQLKINLKPAELGHIEVDLRMRDNALEARFTAGQMVTRDLLETGLSRLKDTLQQSGMDVASIRVNDGSTSRHGGDSTPRQAPQGQPVFDRPGEETSQMDQASLTIKGTNSEGGLDLMV